MILDEPLGLVTPCPSFSLGCWLKVCDDRASASPEQTYCLNDGSSSTKPALMKGLRPASVGNAVLPMHLPSKQLCVLL